MLTLAGLFMLLAAAGAMLPGLPTTPFLLLTSYFLMRSSPRLNQALLKSKFFGTILTDWQQRGAVRLDIKAKAISFVVIAVVAGQILSQPPVWVAVMVGLLAVVGIAVILKLPTARS